MPEQINLKKLSDFDNKSLLIVDDDNPFRDRLARAMEKKGFTVLQAESVQKGIQTVKTNKALQFYKLRVCKKVFKLLKQINQDSLLLI